MRDPIHIVAQPEKMKVDIYVLAVRKTPEFVFDEESIPSEDNFDFQTENARDTEMIKIRHGLLVRDNCFHYGDSDD